MRAAELRRVRSALQIASPGGHGTVALHGLELGTWYEDLHLLACSSPGATSCDDFNELECADPALVPRFQTMMPAVSGAVNDGTPLNIRL